MLGIEGQKRSMTARRPDSAPSYRGSPGPGQYTPSRSFSAKQLPKYSIGREERDGTLGNRHLLGTPAPNNYNPTLATLSR